MLLNNTFVLCENFHKRYKFTTFVHTNLNTENYAANPRFVGMKAPDGAGLTFGILMNFLGNLLLKGLSALTLLFPAFCFAQEEDGITPQQRAFLVELRQCLLTGDKQGAAAHLCFPVPLYREYPLTDYLLDRERFLNEFDQLFPEAYIRSLKEDSFIGTIGWRPIIYLGGEIYGEFEDGLYKIEYYHHPYDFSKEWAAAVALRKRQLHPSLRDFERPEMIAQTNEYILMIDYAGQYGYRLAVWEKPASLMDKPQTVVFNGTYELEGTLHTLHATFTAEDGCRFDVTDFDGPGFYIAEPGAGPFYFANYAPADELFTPFSDEAFAAGEYADDLDAGDGTCRSAADGCRADGSDAPSACCDGSFCCPLVAIAAVVVLAIVAAILFLRRRKKSA